MKVCLISNLYPPNVIGGAEIIVQRVAESLVRKGHDVFVITTSVDGKDSTGKINGVTVYQVNPINLYPFYNYENHMALLKPLWHLIDLWNLDSYIRVKKILMIEKPDIVHINNFKGLSISVFGAVKDLNLPLVFTAHDYSTICIRANLLNNNGDLCTGKLKLCFLHRKAQKYLLDNKPDVFIAPSQFMIDKIRSTGLFKDVETVLLPNGIKLNNKRIEKDYKIIDILYVGALSKHKGVHVLINVFKNIENDNIRLHIVGRGKEEEILMKMAKNDNRIIFHGFVLNKKIIDFYQKANITVVPSIWYENSPTVIYESFMSGTPVIGSKVGGIPELITEGKNGFLFEAGNVSELEKILEGIIDNPSKLKELENGASKSIQKYSIENHMNKLIKTYNSLSLVK